MKYFSVFSLTKAMDFVNETYKQSEHLTSQRLKDFLKLFIIKYILLLLTFTSFLGMFYVFLIKPVLLIIRSG